MMPRAKTNFPALTGCTAGPLALQLDEALPFERWLELGKQLGTMERSVQWWIGDWWAFGGARQWGEGEELAEAAGIEYQYAMDCGSVARAYAFSSRDENLSFKHFRIAMAAPAGQRQEWLQRAVDRGWAATELHRQIARGQIPDRIAALPAGQFRVLYADPPWQYNDARRTGDHRQSTGVLDHYADMDLGQLAALGVEQIAAPDSVLFCWATVPLLPEALATVAAWGFAYKTHFVWDKGHGSFGTYHDAEAELLIVATRGSCTPEADRKEKQIQRWPRGRHSAKPEQWRALIDRLYPSGPRIELFRRGECPPGWVVWGAEAVEEEAA